MVEIRVLEITLIQSVEVDTDLLQRCRSRIEVGIVELDLGRDIAAVSLLAVNVDKLDQLIDVLIDDKLTLAELCCRSQRSVGIVEGERVGTVGAEVNGSGMGVAAVGPAAHRR